MSKSKHKSADPGNNETELRIVGGRLRGSKLTYHGDPVTRPMKHRVREAIFNLVSMEAEVRLALDLFAGTGALGFEAISRGAQSALFIERHIPTARVTHENIAHLGLKDQCVLLEASAFVWAKRDLAAGRIVRNAEVLGKQLPADPFAVPWLVFISPPYAFFVDRQEVMLELITTVIEQSPSGSTIVVESDERFDFDLLPGPVKQTRHDSGWDVRPYPPAVVGVWRT
ncbi:RsmD family RNA methyltransferase [Aeoliella mucimassa]|uniref:Ribosomal RNA small subunit methyltransferase D n=1 Tax=Aeoliella mucimassa TaxID=2527972 RepID=A0A518ATP1_9BACT|nr:RsmD family RNA methyltransferase [Aeoliella mucimassa]QDU58100.1 Ribosomal RNA small subunit methyltransferase D [Aeoliella mucimassa]